MVNKRFPPFTGGRKVNIKLVGVQRGRWTVDAMDR